MRIARKKIRDTQYTIRNTILKGLHYQAGLNILAAEKLGPGVPR